MAVGNPLVGAPLLAVFPHPDDEIFVAGLLAHAVQSGVPVRLVCATRGESGRSRVSLNGASLGDIRSAELAQSCATLGLPPPCFLDLPDGMVSLDAASQALAPILRRSAPKTIVTFGPDGLYGHKDHVALSQAVRAAIKPDQQLLFPLFPSELFRPVHRALHRFGCVVPDYLATPSPEDATLELELSQSLQDLKVQAVSAHQSQLKDRDVDSFLRQGLLSHLLEKEWYGTFHATAPALR